MKVSSRRIRATNWNIKSPDSLKKPAIASWSTILVIVISLVWLASFAIGFQASVEILTVGSLGILILGLRKPVLGFLGMGMMSTLDAISRNLELLGGLWRFNTYNYWLVIVMALNIIFILRLRDPHSRLLQLFLILITLQLLISPIISEGIEIIFNLITTFGLIVYFAKGIRESDAYYWLGIVCGFLGAVGGLVYILQLDAIPYINPNSWSIFPLSAIFAICLGFSQSIDHRSGRLLMIVLAGINFLWIFLSGSRGTMLSGIICLIYLILTVRSVTLTSILFASAVALMIGFSTILVDQQTYSLNRLGKLFDESYTLEERTSGRSEIMELGWNVFLENPLGVGTGGFRSEASNLEFYEGRTRPAHSAWIKTLAENGIIGILLLSAFVFSFAWVGWRKRAKGFLLLGIFISLSFAIGFISKEFQGKSLWFLAAGGIVLFHRESIVQFLESNFQKRLGRKYSRSRPVVSRIEK